MGQVATLTLLLATTDVALAGRMGGAGIRVVTVDDGFEAIQKAVKLRPDVVVLGEELKKLPGPTVAFWLKVNPLTASIPVVWLAVGEGNAWEDSLADVLIPFESVDNLLQKTIEDLTVTAPRGETGNETESFEHLEPISVALDLVNVYEKRLRLSKAMMGIAAVQHELDNFDHTVRLLLDISARVLDARMLSLTILRDRAQYVLVKGAGLGTAHLRCLEEKNLNALEKRTGKKISIEQKLVFGRKRLVAEADCGCSPCMFFHEPIIDGGETIGLLSGLRCESGSTARDSLWILPDLLSQMTMVLKNAQTLRENQQHLGELASILRAALETSSISPVADSSNENSLLQYLLIVLELCHASRGCVVLFDESTGAVTQTAAVGCDPQEVLLEDFKDGLTVAEAMINLASEEAVFDSGDDESGPPRRMVIPLAVGGKVMGGLVVLSMTEPLNFRIIQAVKTVAGMGGYFICNSALYKKALKSSIIEDQLKIAREIQQDMIPACHPELEGYDIFGKSVPARQVGGDYFDYITGLDNRLHVAIADVSGKGIPASLLMTMTKALVVAAVESNDSPEKALREVNSRLVSRISSGQFVTASLLALGKDAATFSCAGHCPFLVYRRATDSFEEVTTDGIAMGILHPADFENTTVYLSPGDVGLLYTDGLNEAMNARREQFGIERIRETVRLHASESSEKIVDALFEAIEEHAAGADRSDDTTVVVIKKI